MSSSAQRSRRREQKENTRREILAAADRFLRVRQYRELSVDVVMAPTGLTRTAFYRHFDDLSQLVLRLLADVGHELYVIAEHWREAAVGGDFATASREGLNGIVDFFVRHGPLIRAVSDAATTDEQIEHGYRAFIEDFVELIRTGLEARVERGELDIPDAHALAVALNLMNESYLLEEFGHEPYGDPDLVKATLEWVWLRLFGG